MAQAEANGVRRPTRDRDQASAGEEGRVSEDLLNPETSERYLIAALGFNAADVERELTDLPGSAFYRSAFGGVWDAARALRDRNIPIEPVSLSRELARRDQWNAASQAVVAGELMAGPAAGLVEHH